jgi:hypothetical protein
MVEGTREEWGGVAWEWHGALAWLKGDHVSTLISVAEHGLMQRRYQDHYDHTLAPL